jgi:excisionase family DNA binding protein
VFRKLLRQAELFYAAQNRRGRRILRTTMKHHPGSSNESRVNHALLSVNQAASLVGLKHLAIRRAIQRGELPAYRLCSRIRIRRDDLAKWVRDNRVGCEPSPRQERAP